MTFSRHQPCNLLAYWSGRGRKTSCCVVGRRNGTTARERFLPRKMAQENLIKASSIPYTSIRATQFFEFVNGIADSPPRATSTLSTALIRLWRPTMSPVRWPDRDGVPVNGTVEIGGPESFISITSPARSSRTQ